MPWIKYYSDGIKFTVSYADCLSIQQNSAKSLKRSWYNRVKMHIGFLAPVALGGRNISALHHQASHY